MIDVENWLHLLGQEMHADFVLIGLGPQFNLSEDLIGERVAHDEARVAHSTAQVNETTLSQHNDMPAILHRVAVDLQCEVQMRILVASFKSMIYSRVLVPALNQTCGLTVSFFAQFSFSHLTSSSQSK